MSLRQRISKLEATARELDDAAWRDLWAQFFEMCQDPINYGPPPVEQHASIQQRLYTALDEYMNGDDEGRKISNWAIYWGRDFDEMEKCDPQERSEIKISVQKVLKSFKKQSQDLHLEYGQTAMSLSVSSGDGYRVLLDFRDRRKLIREVGPFTLQRAQRATEKFEERGFKGDLAAHTFFGLAAKHRDASLKQFLDRD